MEEVMLISKQRRIAFEVNNFIAIGRGLMTRCSFEQQLEREEQEGTSLWCKKNWLGVWQREVDAVELIACSRV